MTTTNETPYIPPSDFPLPGTFIGELLTDPTKICIFQPTENPTEFVQLPVTWAGEPIQGVFLGRQMTDIATTCFFVNSDTRPTVFYMVAYSSSWDQLLCGCPGGVKGQHKHDCKHLRKLALIASEYLPDKVKELPSEQAATALLPTPTIHVEITQKGILISWT